MGDCSALPATGGAPVTFVLVAVICTVVGVVTVRAVGSRAVGILALLALGAALTWPADARAASDCEPPVSSTTIPPDSTTSTPTTSTPTTTTTATTSAPTSTTTTTTTTSSTTTTAPPGARLTIAVQPSTSTFCEVDVTLTGFAPSTTYTVALTSYIFPPPGGGPSGETERQVTTDSTGGATADFGFQQENLYYVARHADLSSPYVLCVT